MVNVTNSAGALVWSESRGSVHFVGDVQSNMFMTVELLQILALTFARHRLHNSASQMRLHL